MEKFQNEWYNKGYEDGFADAVNNINADDVIDNLQIFSPEELGLLFDAIKKMI